jgi:hypothetical protein
MFLEMLARLKEALFTNPHRFQIFEEWDVCVCVCVCVSGLCFFIILRKIVRGACCLEEKKNLLVNAKTCVKRF